MATLKELEEYMPSPTTLQTWRRIASRLEAATEAEDYDQHRHYGRGYARALYDAGLINEAARDNLQGAMMTSFDDRHLVIPPGA